MEVDHSSGHAKEGWSLFWTWLDFADCQGQTSWFRHACQTHVVLGLVHCEAQAPRTWLTVKFKRLRSNMHARPTLPWAWRTVKPKRLGLNWLLSPNVLDMTCVSDPRYLGLGALLSPSTLDLVDNQVQML
jgi:hypothetical protein